MNTSICIIICESPACQPRRPQDNVQRCYDNDIEGRPHHAGPSGPNSSRLYRQLVRSVSGSTLASRAACEASAPINRRANSSPSRTTLAPSKLKPVSSHPWSLAWRASPLLEFPALIGRQWVNLRAGQCTRHCCLSTSSEAAASLCRVIEQGLRPPARQSKKAAAMHRGACEHIQLASHDRRPPSEQGALRQLPYLGTMLHFVCKNHAPEAARLSPQRFGG